MRVLSTLTILFLLFSITSCDKWDKKEKETSFYYSTDYKNGDGVVLGVNVAEIDALYTVYFYEGKTLKYKLVAESFENEKGDNVLAYEEGLAGVDDNLRIKFTPQLGTNQSYSGYFENQKKNFKATLPGLNSREINFDLKKK